MIRQAAFKGLREDKDPERGGGGDIDHATAD